jgi:hypothetical protein
MLNIDANVASLTDENVRRTLVDYAAHVAPVLARADAVVESVRARASG